MSRGWHETAASFRKSGIEATDRWFVMLRNALEKNYDRLDEVLAGMEQPTTKTITKTRTGENP